MFERVITLIYKELLALWRDKKSRFVLIVPPLLQLMVFSLAATLDVRNVPIAILNQDSGRESYELLQRFHGSPTFNKIIYLESVNEIAPTVDNQRAVMVIYIDQEFSNHVRSKEPATIQFILDGRKSNTAQIVQGYAASILNQYNADLAATVDVPPQYTTVVSRYLFNPNLLYYWFNVPNLSGILTMLIALTLTALSVARERELGTFDQLLVSPVQPLEILIGKTIPAILVGLIEGTVIIAAAIFIFRIPFTGSLVLLYISMFVFICSIAGVGLFISSLSSTQQQAILGAFIFMSPAVLLSGYATPIENMPEWLQTFTLINPLRYYLVVAKGVFLKNMPATVVFDNTWPMALIACFTLTASALLFRRRLQ